MCPALSPCYSLTKAALIMACYEQGNLDQYLDAQAPRWTDDWPAKGKLMQDVTRGLLDLHQKDLLHRELKSSNVLIDAHGQAVLSGFGLASAKTLKVQTLGCPQEDMGWAAPEYFDKDGTIDKASDVYGLGMPRDPEAAFQMADRLLDRGDLSKHIRSEAERYRTKYRQVCDKAGIVMTVVLRGGLDSGMGT